MAGLVSGVAGGADHNETRADRFFDRLRELVVQIGPLFVAARRDIDDFYAVLLAMF